MRRGSTYRAPTICTRLSPTKRAEELFIIDFYSVDRLPLTEYGKVPNMPGVYALYVSEEGVADRRLPDYLRLLAAGDVPVYVGKTDHKCRPRIAQHYTSISVGRGIDPRWFDVGALPMPEADCGRGERALLIALTAPPWNASGFGNKDPSKRRMAQEVTIWDRRYPGRGRGERSRCSKRDRIKIETAWEALAEVSSWPGFVDVDPAPVMRVD